jgi:dTDP-4-amino-4,6-dideoxygalactose transaminase
VFKAYPRHVIDFNSRLLRLLLRSFFYKKTGKLIADFEESFARFLGKKYAAVVPSARFGFYAGLRSKGWGAGDEVIMPAYTFKAMALVVKAAGLKPVFVDCKPHDFNIDENAVESKITDRTRAILVSHMFGVPCELQKIVRIARKYGLLLMEDCAHACGSFYMGQRTGSFGDFSLFSFGVGKNIVCLGGGIVATDDPALDASVRKSTMALPFPSQFELLSRALRVWVASLLTRQPFFTLLTYPVLLIAGLFDVNFIDRCSNENMDLRGLVEGLGHAKRFSPSQAVLGSQQLRYLDEKNKVLASNTALYDALLEKPEPGGADAGFPQEIAIKYYYMIRAVARDAVRRRFLLRGIDTKADDMGDCSSIESDGDAGDPFPNTARVTRELLEIPHNVFLREKDIRLIARAVREVLS